MKVAYSHLVEKIQSKPSIEELSFKLFQLGHENTFKKNIFDIELTPNRGDCLSITGLLRELNVFYEVDLNFEYYEDEIKPLKINFENKHPKACKSISFLKIEIEDEIHEYKDEFELYFADLDIKKNNFFTDISNYLSYECGHPLHCYDLNKLNGDLSFESLEDEEIFNTLLNSEINLEKKSPVFKLNNEVINLAGIIGGKYTSCSKTTRSVLVECAQFAPEEIIGKALKYGINSEAAYKFERGVDPCSQEKAVRRFTKIVENHAKIKNVELFSKDFEKYKKKYIKFDPEKINSIIGMQIASEKQLFIMQKLGFVIDRDSIEIPSFRRDIENHNDLAEEIARVIGYDNIIPQKFKIISTEKNSNDFVLAKLKSILIDNGFYEVINFPFVSNENKSELNIKVDNPLDSNRGYLRTNLKDSLIKNLLYNERRQKDSLKLFEISDIYFNNSPINKINRLGIIASGRIDRNYLDFSKEIDINYMNEVLEKLSLINKFEVEEISRNKINSKSKKPLFYAEIDFRDISSSIKEYPSISKMPQNCPKYKEISEFPSSSRDLSVLLKDYSKSKLLQDKVLKYKNDILKETFIFDYYHNEKKEELKIGFRFIFQSTKETVKDVYIDDIMNDIICLVSGIKTIEIPGLKIDNKI